MVNKGLKRALNEFRVYCPHRLHGCEWEGELGKLDEHLNSDPLPERQLKGCPFAVIECLHCKEGIRRVKIAGHQLKRCPQRLYMCEYCAEYKSTFEDVAHSHWPECKCFLLPCPNECKTFESGLQRQCLDQHVKEQCPLTVVQCELHHAGCEVTLPRKDMADHMKEDSISHISLLAAENHRLSKRLLEKEEQICLLTQQNAELEEKQSQDLRELRTAVEMQHIVPVTIKMAAFDELKKAATRWHSRPFYTGMGGYKMCLSVDANGCGAGEGTHVSVFTCLMCGEFDSHLKWPFRGTVTFQLVNQMEDKRHLTGSYDYSDETPDTGAARVTDGERSDGWGYYKFLPHSELGLSMANNRQYLKDDCLIFRIVSVELK